MGPLQRAPALIREGCARLTGGVCIKLLTKLRHKVGALVGGTTGSAPGRWISAGWCTPQPPVNPPIRRETFSCAATPARLGGRPPANACAAAKPKAVGHYRFITSVGDANGTAVPD